MPSKFKTKEAELTWDFSPTKDYLLDKSGPLSSKLTGAPIWGQTPLLWTTDVVHLIRSIGGSRGGLRTDQEKWNAWDELNPKNKRKLIRVLLEIQGIKYEKQQQLKEYKITIENINLLVDECEKWESENQTITVENINLVDEWEKWESQAITVDNINLLVDECEKSIIEQKVRDGEELSDKEKNIMIQILFTKIEKLEIATF